MGDFEVKERWKVYLDKQTKEKLREILDHLEENYDGPSDFVQQKIIEEEPLDIDERIRRAEQEEQEAQRKKEQLKQVKREREQQDKLRDKRELLQKKQEKLREVAETDSISREEAEEKVLAKFHGRSTFEGMSEEEIRETRAFQKQVESMVDDYDVDQLVEDVQRLQKQVAELNGGPEDYFMDLQESSVEVQSV